MKSTRLPSPTLLALATAVAMGAAIAAPNPVDARRIKPADPPAATCGTVRDRLIDLAAQQAINRRYGYYWKHHLARTGEVTSRPTTDSSGPEHHTTTNVQESGVDEADTVKSDGKYIYTIAKGEVVILDSWPISKLSVISRYKLPAGVTPSQLLLRGDQLVVLSRVYERGAPVKPSWRGRRIQPHVWPRISGFSGTRITVLDISNRRRPTAQSTTDVEGSMTQARLVGDDLYLVSNASLRVPDRMTRAADWFARRLPSMPLTDIYNWKTIQKLRAAGLPKVRSYLRRKFRFAQINDAMPRTRSAGRWGQMRRLRPMYSCHSIALPQYSANQFGILNVSHIDLDNPRRVDNTGVFGRGWGIYASTKALYVAMPTFENQRAQTNVHKFSFTNGKPRYAGAGIVPGTLLNQFSMSEHRGYLRIATTDQRTFVDGEERQSSNNLFVLRERWGGLHIVGRLTGLARGERIYSARMIGDKGYVVTFRQTDPLFTLDLSNPRAPKVVGELKINGFSSYIHPLDNDRLLTIGRDADDDGRVKGVHLQIFDVSNPAKPVRTHQQLLSTSGSSWSPASHDHKAFTYDPVTKTLALPLSTYSHRNPRERFNGLVVYAIDGIAGFDELGRISHTGPKQTWRAQITRSMIIDDTLVSFSGARVEAHDLSQLSANSVALRSVAL